MSSHSIGTDSGGRRVIVVCGASGLQGGSVARHLLYRQEFIVKVLTRNPKCEPIQELYSLGAEVVVADFDEPKTLLRAFLGAYGVFGVTSFTEEPERRMRQGRAMMDAAKKTGVRHFIWSKPPSGIDGPPITDPSVPFTVFYAALFYVSIFSQISPSLGHWKGIFFIPLDTVIPSISVNDIGSWVSHAFCNPAEWKGRILKPCTEMMTLRQYIKVVEEDSGLPVRADDPTMEAFLASEHVNPIWKSLKWYVDNGSTFFDPKITRSILPTAHGWKDYVDERLHDEEELLAPVVVKLNVDVHVD